MILPPVAESGILGEDGKWKEGMRMEGKNRNIKQESTVQHNFKFLCHLPAPLIIHVFLLSPILCQTFILRQALCGAGDTGLDLMRLFT